jgi:twinkle protein
VSDDSELLHKGPCDDCGSSDARAVYDDGHEYCFACPSDEAYKPSDGGADGSASVSSGRTKGSGEEAALLRGTYSELKKRGIFEETCKRYDYRIAEDKGRKVQVATYCDPMTGVPVAQKGRTADKDFFVLGPLKKAGLYGQHLYRTGGNKVVITEGEIDCLSVAQAQALKWPTVSIPNGAAGAAKALAAQMEWLNGYKEIVLWFDNDEPGREAVEACVKLFPAGKVKVIVTPDGLKDANDVLREKGAAAVVQCIWDAKTYRPDGVIGGGALTVERLKAKAAPGWQTPYPEVNRLTRGIRPRQLWVLTAGTGVGKSTDAREWAYAMLCEGLSVGMVFLEEGVEDTGKYLVALDHSIPAEDLEDNPDMLSDEQWSASVAKLFRDETYQAYDHFGSSDSDALLLKLEFMALNGAQYIFLDHLTIAATGLDNDGQDELMVKLRSMVERTGVSVIAIAHIRKEKSGERTAEEGAQISLSSLKGSGSLKQVPDVIIAKERDQQAEDPEDRDVSMLRVLKVRRGGKTGPADYLRYNPKTGRLTPCDPPKQGKHFDDEETGDDKDF